jgi:proline iminopeptidase
MVAQGPLKERICQIADGEGTDLEKLDRIWEVVDPDTVDRFLFRDPNAALLNRRLWRESGLVNTGRMHRALQRQLPRTPPLLDELPRIAAPALVIVGQHDRNVGLDACRDVAASLPSARLAIFESSAHFPDIEEPRRYAAEVKHFMTSYPGPPAVGPTACAADRIGR